MGTGGDFWSGRPIEVKTIDALTLSARMNGVFADAVTVITRPADRRFMAFQITADGVFIKPGYHPGRTFLDGDVVVADDEIGDVDHGFTAGDGPYQITSAGPVLAGSPGVIIDETGGVDTLTRDAGSWLDEGFAVNQLVTLGGSASNNGVFTITIVTALVITVAEAVTDEGTQTDLTLTAAAELPTGLFALRDYFVGVVDDDTYTLHTSHNGAKKDLARVDLSLPEMTASTSIVIAAGPDGTFTRTVGSWIDEGFQVGHDIIVSGSASNNAAFTVSAVTALVLSVSATLTGEAAQTDLVITAQFPGGVQTIGALAVVAPSATNEDGQEALHLTAALTSAKVQVIAAPDRLTVQGDAATAEMVYWFLP